MKRSVSIKSLSILVVLLVIIFSPVVLSAGARDQIAGQWRLKITSEGRQRESVLWLSRDKSGVLSGRWLSMYGASELKDLKVEGNKITFSRISNYRDQETESTFAGTIEKAKLTGTLKSPQGESMVEGSRIRFISRAAGTWEMELQGEKPEKANLVIEAGGKGKLIATWHNGEKEDEITNVEFKNNVLTFDRKSNVNGKAESSSFEGTIKGNNLNGSLKTKKGEIQVEATRFGAAIIGRWDLEISSESSSRIQILSVRPDMSAIFGALFVEKVNLEGNNVSFKVSRQIGERNLETSFTGTIENKKLTGEITTYRGTNKVSGTRYNATAGGGQQKQKFRKPDVIFVPTPQKVVDQMLELAQVKKGDVVYDLGCGDGRIVVTAAKKFGCRGFGYDISAKRVKESLENVAKAEVGDLVTIERKDIFTLDLSRANVITLYLLPSLNVKLIPQLEKCKPGTRIVSHDFDMEGVKPDKVITINDDKDEYGDHTLYLWTTPLSKE